MKEIIIRMILYLICAKFTILFQINDDGEFVGRLGKLLNCMGVNLMESMQKVSKLNDAKGTETEDMIRYAVESKLDFMLEVLGNIYDDISCTVFDFSRDYLHVSLFLLFYFLLS